MVKFYSSAYTYDYSFPAVCLAYFLRYPNPYSEHVLSTDVIERSFDPDTQRLTTVRLHLKRSKLPTTLFKLLPKSFLTGAGRGEEEEDGASGEGGSGGSGGGESAGSGGAESQSYILERSTVDVREGWMETESRNLDWTRVLTVVERQVYRRGEELGTTSLPPISTSSTSSAFDSSSPSSTIIPVSSASKLRTKGEEETINNDIPTAIATSTYDTLAHTHTPEQTHVETAVTLLSRLGQTRWKAKNKSSPSSISSSSSWLSRIIGSSSTTSTETSNSESDETSSSSSPSPRKQSFLRSWSAASVQRSVELMGLKRAHRSQPNAKEGMLVVLERLRTGGLVAVLEGRRRDYEGAMRWENRGGGSGSGTSGGGGGAGGSDSGT